MPEAPPSEGNVEDYRDAELPAEKRRELVRWWLKRHTRANRRIVSLSRDDERNLVGVLALQDPEISPADPMEDDAWERVAAILDAFYWIGQYRWHTEMTEYMRCEIADNGSASAERWLPFHVKQREFSEAQADFYVAAIEEQWELEAASNADWISRLQSVAAALRHEFPRELFEAYADVEQSQGAILTFSHLDSVNEARDWLTQSVTVKASAGQGSRARPSTSTRSARSQDPSRRATVGGTMISADDTRSRVTSGLEDIENALTDLNQTELLESLALLGGITVKIAHLLDEGAAGGEAQSGG